MLCNRLCHTADNGGRKCQHAQHMCKPGEAHNIDDLRIFPYLLCLVIFLSYIPVVSVMFSLSLHSPHRHLVSSSLVHLRIIRWSCQFPGPTTSEAAVRRQPSNMRLKINMRSSCPHGVSFTRTGVRLGFRLFNWALKLISTHPENGNPVQCVRLVIPPSLMKWESHSFGMAKGTST